MGNPLLIDLFCGAGGAAMGYHLAGFRVLGVDVEPQPNYPFKFVQEDAFKFIEKAERGEYGDLDIAVIHASPPCQAYSTLQNWPNQRNIPRQDLIPPVRELLLGLDLPYVIENVEHAPLEDPVFYCGSMFGLKVQRHRGFESNVSLTQMDCNHQPGSIGVYGDHPQKVLRLGKSRRRIAATLEEAREAMGIGWMTWEEICEAIPPAYTQQIGAEIRHELGI